MILLSRITVPYSNVSDLEVNTGIDNSALKGGAIKATNSRVSLTGSVFKQNYAFVGCAIKVDNDSKLRLVNIRAQGNYAIKSGGVIQILTYSTLELISSELSDNYAG
jgi:hypothetical protein